MNSPQPELVRLRVEAEIVGPKDEMRRLAGRLDHAPKKGEALSGIGNLATGGPGGTQPANTQGAYITDIRVKLVT